MLHPLAWWRRKVVDKAVRGYPVYAPPHLTEERLLTRDQSIANFDYFMKVRVERSLYFHDWIRRHFSLPIDVDRFSSIVDWAPKYATFLMPLECTNPREIGQWLLVSYPMPQGGSF